VNAVIAARRVGAKTSAITGFSGGDLVKISDECLIIPSSNMQIIEDFHLLTVHLLLLLLND
jgi:D-sedoheptulose 7-phosphate isomerase